MLTIQGTAPALLDTLRFSLILTSYLTPRGAATRVATLAEVEARFAGLDVVCVMGANIRAANGHTYRHINCVGLFDDWARIRAVVDALRVEVSAQYRVESVGLGFWKTH